MYMLEYFHRNEIVALERLLSIIESSNENHVMIIPLKYLGNEKFWAMI